jgi:hypothetical protein
MVDELDAVPGGEHVDDDTRGGGAITELGIMKSLVSGMSVVETGCIVPWGVVNVPRDL